MNLINEQCVIEFDENADYADRFASWFEFLILVGVDREAAFMAAIDLANGVDNYE